MDAEEKKDKEANSLKNKNMPGPLEFERDLVIIGGGPAGLAAAQRADEAGIGNILLIERDSYLGGILPQCIHGGFGLKVFNRELTGPEYSQIFVDRIDKTAVKVLLDTMALDIKRTQDKKGSAGFKIITASRKNGFRQLSARSVILALGCRERTRGQIMLPGSRPAGVYSRTGAEDGKCRGLSAR